MKNDNNKLLLALSQVSMNPQHVDSQGESGYFKTFLANIGNVWARRGRRWVARRRSYDRTHITTVVCVSAAGQAIILAPSWTGKTVSGCLLNKEACHVFIKATQDDN